MKALDRIAARQNIWSQAQGLRFSRPGYVQELSDNLFQALSMATRLDFKNAPGQETGFRSNISPPKMHALESSSALLCNLFDFWRTRSPKEVGRALGIANSVIEVKFEAEFRTGLRGTSPTLDMALTDQTEAVCGVEAKFCEPYRPKTKRPPFSNAYFPIGKSLWASRGLDRCQKLAEDLNDRKILFERLDVPQLLKHALGLWSQPRKAHLLFLWYEEKGPEAEELKKDLESFAGVVDPQLDFRAVTYHEAFQILRDAPGVDHNYVHYLSDRYFST